MATPVDNCLVIVGCLAGPLQTRYSPLGLPISRFMLEHHSQQYEAGQVREARCCLPVFVGGETLHRAVAGLATGSRVRIRGFLSRADHRQGEFRLVLHATHIETLE